MAGNAFTVINPGYRIVLDGDAPPEREGDDYRLAVDVSPLWSDVNYSDTWPVGELAITQNAQTGKVHVPHLPITRMQSIIQQPLRAIDEASGATKRAKRLLSNIGPGVDLGAYVEYATGQTAAVISAGRVVLSQGDAKKSFYWELGPCKTKGLPESCNERSAQDQFRQWVDLLQTADAPMLRDVGLSLRDLQSAAHQGRVVGSIEIGKSPFELKSILGSPNVRMVYVTSARLRCSPQDRIECRFHPLPKR
ncbi:hypothetical protein OIE66_18835 [Nonomuraea sp. NBC_01738]|uniref:hypothetical protein n=1 Tax=Nonomuraea sp. NBC_01738 TaxID=2976003 RepID=UPI002E107DF0|nr:hypothetical protein OIE66_18835 [Nonomuraea sp. NBC_01738]